MKRLLFSIACYYLLRVWAGFAIAEPLVIEDSLTIQHALQRVVEQYPTVYQSMRGWEASLARADLSNTARLPTLDFEAGYTRLGPSSEIIIPKSPPLETYPLNNYEIHFVGHYMLYDFGRTKTAIDVSRQKVKSVRSTIEIAQSSLAMQTVQAFYSFLFYRYCIVAQDHLIENLTAHHTFTEKQVQTGSATDFDELTTNVRIDIARTQKTDLENNLRKQEIVLRRLLNLPESEPFHVKGSFTTTEDKVHDETLAIETAFRHRPELISAREEETTAQIQSNLVSLGDKPTVGAMASWGLKNGFEPNLDAIRGNWAAGLKLQVPLYNGNATTHKVAEAVAQARIAHLKVEENERQISGEVRQCFADLNTAEAKLQTAQKQVEHAQAALDNANARFRAGTIRNIELLDAETTLTQMKLLQLQTEYMYTLSIYSLEKATGKKYW